MTLFIDEASVLITDYNSEKSLTGFVLKVLLMMLPAVILALITDSVMCWFQTKTETSAITCVLIQTSIIILTIYSLRTCAPYATKEFQTTLSGVFFISLYFGLQQTYYSSIHTAFKDLRRVVS